MIDPHAILDAALAERRPDPSPFIAEYRRELTDPRPEPTRRQNVLGVAVLVAAFVVVAVVCVWRFGGVW